MPAQPVDLNALFAPRIEESREHAIEIPIIFGPDGQKWTVTNQGSHAALLNAGKDPMAYIIRLVIPEERTAFEQMLTDWDGMQGDVLIDAINRLTELIAGEVPTQRPSRSSATSGSRTSGTRSKET